MIDTLAPGILAPGIPRWQVAYDTSGGPENPDYGDVYDPSPGVRLCVSAWNIKVRVGDRVRVSGSCRS